jgi:hypothetical protein
MDRLEQLQYAARIINEMINYLRENPNETNTELLNQKIGELRDINIDIILSEDDNENNSND